MRKISMLFFLFSALVMSSCVKDAKIEMNESMNVIIEGYILDSKTNDPIVGATISGSFGELKSNNVGYYKISGLSMGEYRLTIKADDYLTIIEKAGVLIPDDSFKGDSYVEIIETYMSKPDQSFETKMVTQFGPTYVAFADMPYEVVLNAMYQDRIINGMTDADGNISVDSLPLGSFELNIDYRDSINEVTYRFSQLFYDVTDVSPINIVSKYEDDSDVFYLTSTNLLDEEGEITEEFPITSSITLGFNQNLDTDPTTFDAILMKGGYITVLTDVTQSGSTLTVSLEGDGHLEEGTWYTIEFEVKASDSELEYYSSITFKAAGDEPLTSLVPITNIDLLTDPIYSNTNYLNYDMLVDVNSDYLVVYGNYPYDGTDEFVLLETISLWSMDEFGNINVGISIYNLPGIEIPADGIFSSGRKFELIFQTVSADGVKSDLSAVQVIRQTSL